MSDVWSSALYQASFAGVPFDCLSTSDSIARSVARHTFPRRDGGLLQDMGAEPRSTRARILFFEREQLDGDRGGNHLQRFAEFYAATQSGKAQEFVHPITGTYRAMVEDLSFSGSGDERDVVEVDCTFVEDSTAPAKFDPGAKQMVDSGAAAVAALATKADADLQAAGISSSAPGDASSMVDSWESDPSKLVREVNLDLATVSAQIDQLIDTYEMTSDVSRYPLWRSLVALNYSCQRAASLFRQAQPQNITITVAVSSPLRVIVTETYGARDAEKRYAEVMRLNDIDDPLLVPAGTVLKAPSARRAA